MNSIFYSIFFHEKKKEKSITFEKNENLIFSRKNMFTEERKQTKVNVLFSN